MKDFSREKKILSVNDVILIDTSAIMDYEGLRKLVDDIELPLMEMKKKIIVPKVVWMELNRHINSTNNDKQAKACHALDIICMHPNIFLIGDDNLDQEEMMRAFADAELLSQLTKNKAQYGQLLITNDKKLSRDAFDLNNLESCMGHRINVCYIANNGFLGECKYARFDKKTEQDEKLIEKVVYISRPQKNESWLPKVAIPIASLVVGISIGKYSSQIIKFIKKVE